MEPGMVVVLQPYLWEAGVGGALGKETLLITTNGPERLSRFPHGPLAG